MTEPALTAAPVERLVLPSPFYADDRCVIYHGDASNLIHAVHGIDMVLTDPPYGVGFEYDGYEDTEAAFDATVLPVLRYAIDWMPATVLTMSMRQMWKLPKAKWVLCWAKPGSVRRSSCGGFSEWEPVFVYGSAKYVNDYKYLPDCVNHQKGKSVHPCPKPVNLFRWLCAAAPENGWVLDPFMGSGTTLRACLDEGRRSIGFERSERYCEAAADRLRQRVLF